MCNGTDTVNSTCFLCEMEQTQWIAHVCYVKWNRHSEYHMFVMWNGTDTVNNTCLLCEMEQTQWITHVCYVKWNRHSE